MFGAELSMSHWIMHRRGMDVRLRRGSGGMRNYVGMGVGVSDMHTYDGVDKQWMDRWTSMGILKEENLHKLGSIH